ncbi:hypothetical protein OG589_14770 [Sphaerisporangium sp. NBC_01403]|uniref:hypothetical protein n=1 Tax=Sphaerisporangium sp. NBC_01403 TaxID=2903599 RepID=UPI00324F5122
MSTGTDKGHPGVWGPGMEPESVRKAYDATGDTVPAQRRPICRAKDMVAANTRSAA